MEERDFEGTLVLEKMAEINRLDDFFEAIDSDHLGKVSMLMRQANLDAATIAEVLRRIKTANGEH